LKKGEILDKDRFEIVYELRLVYKVKELIEVVKIARSSYYYYIKNKSKEDKYANIKQKIKDVFYKNKGRYGYRRITMTFKNEGLLLK
jgi:putative transposase